MSTRAKYYRARRTAVRLRSICRRLAALRRGARRAVTLGLAVATLAIAPAVTSHAQTGQTAMAPTGGVVGRAVTGLRGLNDNGPGVLYYGANGADRGFGYRGSYMTLGGFIPVVEDDLGGNWAADIRGHLSEYGGFFSNVGAVRKQFIGGTLLGFGVFWDYDGDANQYDDTIITDASGTNVFDGGQSYNQVGISGEWLTDFGNLRSNGYIPVGSTAQIAGPFIGNSILCDNGVNAALGGADLEVGAYVPGLADWNGMINVGGYAFGNTRYEFPGAQAAVPWFGGVYTRLDMTFIQNWDFSLQANNDSYFDWTGYARLTYRMGGSRRRNVPDQVEQPMMRNEHIARAHKAPVVALNPNNVDAAGNPLPWQIFHVDNSATAVGNGSANKPFQTLAEAEAAAIAAWDIVYVNVGNSLTTPYATPLVGYSFGAENQSLLGEGTSIRIQTVDCGALSLIASNNSNLYPIITNPVGAAINVDQAGTRVDHLDLANSTVGIADGAGFTTPGVATVSDVIIRGASGPFERGVWIANSTGEIRFDNVRLSNLADGGFVVTADSGDVVITNSSVTNAQDIGVWAAGTATQIVVSDTAITGITNGDAVVASGASSVISLNRSTITNTQGSALLGDAAVASGAASRINLTDTTITTTTNQAIEASGAGSVVVATRSTITGTQTPAPPVSGTGDPAVSVTGTTATVILDDTDIRDVTGNGIVIAAGATGAVVQMANRSTLSNVTLDGIQVLEGSAQLFVTGNSTIRDIQGDGIETNGATILVRESSIQDTEGAGIRASGVAGTPTSVVAVNGSTITNTRGGGIIAVNSNLRVDRLDPTNPISRATRITNAGSVGIQAIANTALPTNEYSVFVANSQVGGDLVGISIEASLDTINPPPGPVPTINFTATNNVVSGASGPGISVNAIFDQSPVFPQGPLSRVYAFISANQVQGGLDTDILLNTGGDSTIWPGPTLTPALFRPITVSAPNEIFLESVNNNAVVDILQEPESINWSPGYVVPVPPNPPTPPAFP